MRTASKAHQGTLMKCSWPGEMTCALPQVTGWLGTGSPCILLGCSGSQSCHTVLGLTQDRDDPEAEDLGQTKQSVDQCSCSFNSPMTLGSEGSH